MQIKKPIEVSAPKYVEYLMDWIETQLDDESIFPQRLGNLWFDLLPYGPYVLGISFQLKLNTLPCERTLESNLCFTDT